MPASDVQSGRPAGPVRLLLVTGMSGAGKSTALRAFEDFGYEAVDNLPLALLGPLVSQRQSGDRPIAVGADIRTRDFGVRALLSALDQLEADEAIRSSLLFLDCDDDVLGRRYTETRRRHPLAADRPVLDGVHEERELLSPLRDRADHVIDTTQFSAHDLRRALRGRFAQEMPTGMSVFVTSFAFGRGLPRDADLVFDVRFLTNPHYAPGLRERPGTDPDVADHIATDPDYEAFFAGLSDLLGRLLPRYEAEGKSYLTIAVGCTGGRHRSVHIAERLGAWIRTSGRPATVVHRDLERSFAAAVPPAIEG